MKTFLAIAALAATQLVSAQKTTELKDFKRLTIKSGLEIQLVHGKENKLVTKDNEDGGIEVSYENNGLTLEGAGTAVLYYKNDLESILAGSDAHVAGGDEIKGKTFSLNAGSDSQIALNFNVDELRVTLGSDAQIALKGTSKGMRITAGSDCRVYTKELTAENVTVTLGSDVEAMITAKGIVTATVGSDAQLTIYGNPKKVNETKSGDAEIIIAK